MSAALCKRRCPFSGGEQDRVILMDLPFKSAGEKIIAGELDPNDTVVLDQANAERQG